MTVTKETPKKGIKSPLRFILFYNKRIVRKWQMLITPRIMSTKAVDIPKQRVVDVDNYEDYVDKWNTHIHIVSSGDSVMLCKSVDLWIRKSTDVYKLDLVEKFFSR